MFLIVQLFQTRNHPFGFIKFIVSEIANDLFAFPLIGPQIFWFTPRIVGDDCVSGIQNGLRASVILCKHHCGYFRECIFKFQNIAEVCTTEAIHTLIGVTHHTDVVMQCAEHDHNGVLCHVRVLILVNKNVLKTLLIHPQNVRVLTE